MELRNLPEQVAKNQEDIKQLKSGIRPKYAIDFSDLSTIITEENVGEYAIVNQDGVNKLYIIARRANDELIAKDLGQYPAVVKGEKGDTGSNGADGEVGSTIFGASVNPPTGARIGDFYIQKKIVDGAIDYILNKLDINGIWIPQFSMRGPQGLPGVSENVIIPNPEGESSGDLNSIDINGVIYTIPHSYVDLTSDQIILGEKTFKIEDAQANEYTLKFTMLYGIPTLAFDQNYTNHGRIAFNAEQGISAYPSEMSAEGVDTFKIITANGDDDIFIEVTNGTIKWNNRPISVPIPQNSAVGKVLTAQAGGTYDWDDAPQPGTKYVYRHKLELINESEELPVTITIITKNQSQFTNLADVKLTLNGGNLSNKALLSIVNFGEDRYFYFGIDRDEKYILFDTQTSTFIKDDMIALISDSVSSIEL